MVEKDKRDPVNQDPTINGMAAKVERLNGELAEAREQLAATGEVLAVMWRSASDLEGVLEAVVESARSLCGADGGQIFLMDEDQYRLAYGSGLTSAYRDYMAENPVVLDRGTLAGRVGLDRRATQITDVLADAEYSRPEAQRAAGFRTIMGVPMLLDGEVVGVLSVWRTEVDPFSDRAVEVLSAFAAQAALAVRTVNLVRALESRTAELGQKLDHSRHSAQWAKPWAPASTSPRCSPRSSRKQCSCPGQTAAPSTSSTRTPRSSVSAPSTAPANKYWTLFEAPG